MAASEDDGVTGLTRRVGSSGTFWLGRPPSSEFAAMRAAQARESATYDQVGATLMDGTPAGYRRLAEERIVGSGERSFTGAVEGMRGWRAHCGAGLVVYPEDASLFEGATVVLAASMGPLWAVACCRIVAVVDEPGRFGFAYGTLPLHPEEGEELFVVEHRDDDAVVFRILAFSRHRHPMARIAGPLARWVQQRATRRYLQALADAVDKSA